jgi:hypothetical protein
MDAETGKLLGTLTKDARDGDEFSFSTEGITVCDERCIRNISYEQRRKNDQHQIKETNERLSSLGL